MKNSKPSIRVLAWPARRKRKENPYTWLVQKHTATFGVDTSEFGLINVLRLGWDIIHVHWPEVLLSKRGRIYQVSVGTTLLFILALHKLLGNSKIVWTLHNEDAHEVLYPILGELYLSGFIRLVDGVIFLSFASKNAMLARYPRLSSVRQATIRHGHYRGYYKPSSKPRSVRKRLGVSDATKIILFFGQIRPYKNVCRLIEVFGELAGDYLLIVAGKPYTEDYRERLEKTGRDDERVVLDLEFIPESRLGDYISAASLVVLPFSKILNSGSALLALSLDRPVLVPSTPSFCELKELVGANWVHTFSGGINPGAIREAVLLAPASESADLSAFDWVEIGRKTHSFFAYVLEGS